MVNAVLKFLIERGNGSTGWSTTWRADCWARFFSGNKAYAQLCLQKKSYVYGNLLDNCNDILEVDGNFGAAAAVAEMLLQSQTGTLYLLRRSR